MEGIHFHVLSFHSKRRNGRAIRRKQWKEAPPKGGGKHHTTKRRRAPQRQRKKQPPRRRRGRSSRLLVGGAPFLLFLGVGVRFPCPPLGGADFPPYWVVPFSLKKNMKKLRQLGSIGFKFSSAEWWSLLLPFSGTAFLCLLSGGAAWLLPHFGRAAFLPLFWVMLVPEQIAPAQSAQE